MSNLGDRAAVLADLQRSARALGMVAGGVGIPRLLSLLCDPQVDCAEVLAALRSEPGLSARVLRVANSPFYRRSGEIGTLERAQQVLGVSGLRGIAAAACLDRTAPPLGGPAFSPQQFRRHSLGVACAAQQLSRALALGIDGEAFMAGLLHDVGLLVLAHAVPARLADFKPPRTDHAAPALAAECDLLGMDHGQAAGVLVQAWSLPAWLLPPLTGHHADDATPDKACTPDLAALVRLADHLACRAGLALWPLCEMAPSHGLAGLDAAQIDGIVASLPDQVAAMTGAV